MLCISVAPVGGAQVVSAGRPCPGPPAIRNMTRGGSRSPAAPPRGAAIVPGSRPCGRAARHGAALDSGGACRARRPIAARARPGRPASTASTSTQEETTTHEARQGSSAVYASNARYPLRNWSFECSRASRSSAPAALVRPSRLACASAASPWATTAELVLLCVPDSAIAEVARQSRRRPVGRPCLRRHSPVGTRPASAALLDAPAPDVHARARARAARRRLGAQSPPKPNRPGPPGSGLRKRSA